MKKIFLAMVMVALFSWAYSQDVQLSVQMHGGSESICSGEFQIRIDVSNASNNDATNVKCKLNLPSYVSIVNQADTMILFDLVEAGDDNIFYVVSLRNSGNFGVATSIPLMCQIWDCDQPDAESLAYGQWDWTGNPNRMGARLNVPVMNTASSSDIQIANAEVCYGGTAVLKALAPNLEYPQTFVWYSSDLHTELLREEINGGESQLTIPSCIQSETYYVTVANEDHCPVTLLYNYSTLSLNGNTSGQTSNIAHDDCIYFYDEGGKTGDYPARNATLVHTFKAELENDNLYLSLKSLSLGGGDVLNIYDGTSVDDAPLASLTANSAVQNFQSTGRALTIEFVQGNTSGAGWEAEIAAKQYAKQVSTVLLNPQQDGQMTTVSPLDSILFYDEGGLTGMYTAGDLSCTFTAMMGNVKADFESIGINLRVGDSLIVYDGSSTSAEILAKYSGSSNGYPVLTSTGQSLTFRLKASGNGSGWRAKITSVNPENSMAKATVTIKTPGDISSLIQTTDDEVCYGSWATLRASSTIDYPQYYTWYAPDRIKVLQRDTVTNGEESVFSVLPSEDMTYYVAVTNDESCPEYAAIHDNYREILMDGSEYEITLSATDSIGFFDAGGEFDNYEANTNRSVHFQAPEGSHIKLHFNTLEINEMADAELSFDTGDNRWVYLRGSQTDLDYEIEFNSVYIIFYNWSEETAAGWDAYLYAIMPRDAQELAEAHVSLKSMPLGALSTTDAEVCYGSEATLTASSDITPPQTLVWYSPDRMSIVKKETITSGSSTLTVTPTEETSYYVAVTNADNCPIVEQVHPNYREVLMSRRSSYYLSATDSIGFFDAGGRNGDYEANMSQNSCVSFWADEGSHIKLHFNALEINEIADTELYFEVDNNQWVHLRGSQTDLDYEIERNSVSIYFYNYSEETAAGWDAYIYAITPHDISELAEATVSFMEPVLTPNANVDNVEACYGKTITLSATSTIPSQQYFAWYDKNMNLLHQELTTSGSSSIDVRALENTSYYVNVTSGEECPIIAPNTMKYYQNELLLNESTMYQVTTVSMGNPVVVFDDGGMNGNYTVPSNGGHYFESANGEQLTVQIVTLETDPYNGGITIYDGYYNDYIVSLSGSQSNVSYTSSSNALTFHYDLYGQNSDYPGWMAIVRVEGDETEPERLDINMSEMQLSVDPCVLLTATSDTVCYGSRATLTASSEIDYPQYFTWYASDRIKVLQRDTVTNGGVSVFSVLPSEDVTYYVEVANADNPLEEPTHSDYREVLMDGSETEITLSATDSIGFFDAGGEFENYEYEYGTSRYVRFQAPSGSHIKLHFNTLEINEMADASLNFDAGNNQWVYLRGSQTNLDYEFERDNVELNFYNWSEGIAVGWDAYIYAITPRDAQTMAEAHVSIKETTLSDNAIVSDAEACYGTTITLNATSTLPSPQYFAWYDKNMNLLHQELTTSGSSSIEVRAVENTSYYVNVTSGEECPIIAPNTMKYYQNELLLNESTSDQTTTVSMGNPVVVFDDGGMNGNYSANSNGVHYFESANGEQLTVQIVTLETDPYNGGITIYDGYYNDYIVSLSGSQSNVSYTSSSNALTFQYDLYGQNSDYPGWMAIVRVEGDETEPERLDINMSEMQLSVDPCVLLTATSDTVCYGSHATLTASSEIDYPQTFVWYGPDRISVVRENTIYDGSDTMTVMPTEGVTYYVAVANADNPLEEPTHTHPDYREVLMDGSETEITLSATDSIGFFDAGGKFDNYEANTYRYVHFQAPSGSHIKLHFNTLEIGSSALFYFQTPNSTNYVRGSQADLDYEIEDNNVYIYLSNYYSETAAGWDAYIYAIMPRDVQTMAEAHVSVKSLPLGALNTTDAEVCYGSEATLTASSGIDDPQTFVWYSPDRMSIVKEETITSGLSTLTVAPTEVTSYYVAMTNADNCPIVEQIHPNYREVLMDGSVNNIILSANDSIGFFDAGGKFGNYEAHKSISVYFQAPEGSHIKVHINTLELAQAANLSFSGGNQYISLNGSQTDLDYEIEQNSVEIFFYNLYEETAAGWDAYIYAIMPQDISKVKEAHVSFKEPVLTQNAIVSDVAACYGENITLNASAAMGYPQYFAWYDGDLNLLKQDTILSGSSSLDVQAVSTRYYVNVGAGNECLVLTPDFTPNYIAHNEVRLDANTDEQTTIVSRGNPVVFCDDGGINGNYTPGGYLRHTFEAANGERLSIQIISLEIDYANDHLNVFDVVNGSWWYLAALNGSHSNLSYTSTEDKLAIELMGYSGISYPGWIAVVKVAGDDSNPLEIDVDMSEVQVSIKSPVAPSAIEVQGDEVCYGSEATLTASCSSIDFPQYYTWYSPDRLSVLKRDTILSGESSLTVLPIAAEAYYVSVHNPDNCPVRAPEENALASVPVSLKSLPVNTLNTIDAEACYASNATLKANSTLDYPQYYTWYGPDRVSVIKKDTIESGYSELQLVATEEQNYYVAVTNASNCPIVDQMHPNNYREVLTTSDIGLYKLSMADSVVFYDAGGKDGTFIPEGLLTSFFTVEAPEGSYIKLHFNKVELRNATFDILDLGLNTVAQIEGVAEDLDFIVQSNGFHFTRSGGDGSMEEVGWEGYFYAIMPHDSATVKEAKISFNELDITWDAQVADVEACYGENITLNATAAIDYPQYYAWYDSDMNLLKQELVTDGSSTLDVQAMENTSYYVNVSAGNQCPVIQPDDYPDNFLNVLRAGDYSKGMITVSRGNPVVFLDNGGVNGNYIHGRAAIHNFVSANGERLTMQLVYFNTHPDEVLYISDYESQGPWVQGEGLARLSGSHSDHSYTSIHDGFYITWSSSYFIEGQYPGWMAIIRVEGDDTEPVRLDEILSKAQVSVNFPVAPSAIEVQGDEVCYGSEATLTASCSSIDFPQYYTWYTPDRQSVLKRDTIESGESTLTILPLSAETYYVSVHNPENCPVIVLEENALASVTVSLKASPTSTLNTTDAEVCYGGEAILTASSSIDYPQYYTWSKFTPSGLSIVKEDTVESGISELHLLATGEETYYVAVTNADNCPIVENLHPNYREIRYEIGDNWWNDYWNGYVVNTLSANDSVGFFDAGGKDGTYIPENEDPGYFVVYIPEGAQLRLHFDKIDLRNTTYTIFGPYFQPVTQFGGVVEDLDFVFDHYIFISRASGGSTEEVGWEGYMYAIMPHDVAEATVRLKSSLPLSVPNVTSDTICFGSGATLTASSDIDYPQTYVWYGSDRLSVMKEETIQDGNSTISLSPIEETTYYVAVTNADHCPITGNSHPNYREFLLNGSSGTYNLSATDSVGFFDAGGKFGNYEANTSGYVYFQAPEGSHIKVHINTLELAQAANLSFSGGNQYISLNGSQTDLDYEFEQNEVHVSFYNYAYNPNEETAAGWDAYVYAIMPHDTTELTKATVSFKSTLSDLNVTDAEVCYGSEATLTASSSLGYPQYYTWYNSDGFTVAKHDTVNSGSSELHLSATEEKTYYVAVANDESCPIVESFHPNYREVLVHNGVSFTMTAADSVGFFDAGGKDGTFDPSAEGLISTFYAPEGSHIRIHFTRVDLQNVTYTISDYLNTIQIGGVAEDLDYILESNRFYMYQNGYNTTEEVGWEGYMYAIQPRDSTNTKEAKVRFNELVLSNNAIVADVDTCYGTNITLNATAAIDYPQYYAWYDSDLNLLKQELITSGSSTFDVQATENTSYYVNVSAGNQCPVLTPDYEPNDFQNEVRLNANTTGQTTIVSRGNPVVFLDNGGLNGNYTGNISGSHRFESENGEPLTMEVVSFESLYYDEMWIHGGTGEGRIGYLNGSASDVSYTSNQGVLSISWYSYYNSSEYSGWMAIIRVEGDDTEPVSAHINMSEVQVSVESPLDPSVIDVQGDEVCYGSEATLTASCSSIGFPQYYTWYSSDRQSVLKQDTIESGESSLLVSPLSSESYYVSVSNPYNCPVVKPVHSNYREVLYENGYIVCSISATDSVGFFDAGGKDGSYNPEDINPYFVIYPPANSRLRLHFDKVDLRNTTYVIYDNNWDSIAQFGGVVEDLDFVFDSYIFISRTSHWSTTEEVGWEGYFYAIAPYDAGELASAEVTVKPRGESVDELSICREELPVTMGSTTLENTISSGVYEVTYPQASANGCDSVVTLNVTVLESSSYTETQYIYSLPYTWYDTTFLPGTQSGTYEYHLENAAGCDSAMILDLVKMCDVVMEDTVNKVVCAASVTLGTQTYTANGQYNIVYFNVHGCDSTVTTNLVLNHPDNPAYKFTLDCPAAVYDTIKANECTVVPQLGMPTFEHYAQLTIPSYSDSITITNDAPAEFQEGETVVHWTAVDNCGNTATCEQHVYIAREECPLAVDYEGNTYQTVRLGNNCLCWMAENLRSTQYSDGRPIDNVMSYSSELFPNEAVNVSIYGHLYDWYAAADTATNSVDSVERSYAMGKRIHGICPEGWYLPTDEDIDGLNVYSTADLRSTDYWLKGGGTNSTGFNAVPGGMYNCSTDRYEDLTAFSFYWSCHPVIDKATGGLIDYVCEKILMQDIPHCSGLSVRCVNKEW